MKDVLPDGCAWIQDKVTEFDPENNTIKLSTGKNIQYDYLVVAMGLQLNFDQVCIMLLYIHIL